jgi:hypothetical protein
MKRLLIAAFRVVTAVPLAGENAPGLARQDLKVWEVAINIAAAPYLTQKLIPSGRSAVKVIMSRANWMTDG